MRKSILILIIILNGTVIGQENLTSDSDYYDFQISSERYLTDQNGNISIYVNVWGSVPNPGRHLVYDGIDFATLLAIVGGPKSNANLKGVKLYREIPEIDGTLSYSINLKEFLETGARTNFIEIKPNDTILVPEKLSSAVWGQVGTLNTIFSLLTLYFTIEAKILN